MLSHFKRLPFAMIDPKSNWEDIGFTEREIWVNSKGYGYIMCDEVTQCWDGPGLGINKWSKIKEKIQNESLTYEDIEGTTISDLLDTIHYGYDDFDDSEQLCSDLADLALTDYPANYFYAMATDDGVQYFNSKEAFDKAYERDWADVEWDSMSDDLLIEWIDRLSVEDDSRIMEWVKGIDLDSDFCVGSINDVTVTGKIKSYWTANNTKYFRFCSYTTVKEGKKKRFVYLTAEGKDEKDKETNQTQYYTMTTFNVISTRENLIAHFVVSGNTKPGESIATDEDMGKWAALKNAMFDELLNMTEKIAGNDPYARSVDLYLGLKKALNTSILDTLIRSESCRGTQI